MPAGFPKGQAAYTTAKVIVARAFAPAGDDVEVRAQALRSRAVRARDPRRGHRRRQRRHDAPPAGVKVSGIAPRAYIGNYKALSVPTDANVGLDGNAPELVARSRRRSPTA